MSWITVFVAVILAVFSYWFDKKIYNPITLFCGIWAFVVFMASLHLYGMVKVSDAAYVIILVGIICFSLGGFMAAMAKNRIVIRSSRTKKIKEYVINYRIVYIVGGIVLIYLIMESITAFIAYRSGIQMNELRSSMMGYSDTGYASGMSVLRQGPLALIYSFVFLPGFYSLLLVTSVDTVIGKRNKILIFMSILAVALKNYAEGSRMCLTHLALYFMLLFFIYKRGVLSKKAKKWIIRGVVLVVIVFLIVSNIRFSTSQKTMAEQLYLYLTCSIPLFDYWLGFEKATGIYTYGAVSLLGLLRLPCNILKIFGITVPTVILNNANVVATNWDNFVNIGPHLNYNSYATMFMYFYKDAGMIGIIMGSFIFGFVVMRVYKRLNKTLAKGEIPLRLTYIYVLLGCFVIQSYIRFFFSRTDYAMILYYALIFFKRKKNINEQRDL